MLDRRRGLLFPAPAGGHIDINNWRGRQWTPGLDAAGVQHRRIYDLRHTYATWSLAAGIDIFTLARRMGSSVKMIDRTYGHLVAQCGRVRARAARPVRQRAFRAGWALFGRRGGG